MYRYRSVHVSNYRCFRDLALRDLARVNLLAGPNNVGKTALLECMFQLSGGGNPGHVVNVNAFRGITEYHLELTPNTTMPWAHVFHLLHTEGEILLTGQMTDGSQLFLSLRDIPPEDFPKIPLPAAIGYPGTEGSPAMQSATHALQADQWTSNSRDRTTHYLFASPSGLAVYPPPAPVPFPGYFLGARSRVKPDEEVRRFDAQEKSSDRPPLAEVLRVLEPRLVRLALHYFGGVAMIHGDIGMGQPIPLALMGEGLARLLSIILAINEARGGVVFIDEIENGIYYERMPEVWKAIGAAARQADAQVFATTHSRECIREAHRAFLDSGVYDFALHRMEFYRDTVRAVTYQQDELEEALKLELELR